MDIQDHINNLKEMNSFQVGLISNYIKPYIHHNNEKLTAMDGYQLALISQNLTNYWKVLIYFDKSPDYLKDEDIKFKEDFEKLLEFHHEMLPEVFKTYEQEMEELKESDPEVYKDFMNIVNKKDPEIMPKDVRPATRQERRRMERENKKADKK